MLARWQEQLRADTYKQEVKSTLGMVWIFWNCKLHPQWHTFSSEATTPNPSPTVPPTGDRVFRHECWRPQSAQWQTRHGRERLEREASWSHLNCTQETTTRKLCILFIYIYVCVCMIMMTIIIVIITPQSLFQRVSMSCPKNATNWTSVILKACAGCFHSNPITTCIVSLLKK